MAAAFKLGRNPGRIPTGLRYLTYYAAGDLPAAPSSLAIPLITDWGMNGNAEYGDCGVAGGNHGFMATAFLTGETETFPTDQQVVDYYLAYTGGQDVGVVLADYLSYVRANKFYGHSISAYAPVSVSDARTLTFTVWAYGFAYTGISVTQAMMDACSPDGPWQPWTGDMAQGNPIGGHCIPVVGYDDSYLYAVTWGQVQKISWPAWHIMAQEAWAVVTGELVVKNGDARGISLPALISDLNEVNQ